MGSGTLRDHKSTCLIRNADLINERLENFLTPQPISIIVSQNQQFSNTWNYFFQPVRRWILSINEPTEDFDSWIKMDKSWDSTLSKLHEQGVKKLLLLGGAKLASSLLSFNLVDEIQFTLTPKLVGGNHLWLLGNVNYTQINENWKLEKLESLCNDEVMLRYSRKRK